jgi:hypothetical protein
VLRKGWDRIFGVGTLEFSTAASTGADITFYSIKDAEKIRTMVNDLRD